MHGSEGAETQQCVPATRLIVGAGQRSAIVTLVERKTRSTILRRLATDHSAQSVGDTLIRTFTGLPAGLCRSLTWDQGNEMLHHHRIEIGTGLKIYFCDPHAPWQRRTNENTNGLLRQYFPKGTDLGAWTSNQLDHIATELNHRPRVCLNDKSPHDLMQQWERRLIAKIIRNDH